MLKGQPLREILVIVHLIVPLTTGCHELFNLLKGNFAWIVLWLLEQLFPSVSNIVSELDYNAVQG